MPVLSSARPDAVQLSGARVTFASGEVRSRMAQGGLLPLSIGDIAGAGLTIDNGVKARAELTFANRTIVRLGANTLLQLQEKSGAMKLREGAILFQLPKGSAAEIATDPVTLTSNGATGLLDRSRDLYIKLLLLEGEARVSLPGQVGESILMKPGEILIMNPKATVLPEPANFDIARQARTCRLISDFPPLRSKDLIVLEAQKQARLTSSGTYTPSNLVIFGRGTLVSLVQPQSETPRQKRAAAAKPPQ